MLPVTVTVCAPAVAVDPTDKVTVAAVPGVIDAGLTLAVMPVGALTVNETEFLADPLSVTPTVNVAVFPVTADPDDAD